jgi:hypothetical protein
MKDCKFLERYQMGLATMIVSFEGRHVIIPDNRSRLRKRIHKSSREHFSNNKATGLQLRKARRANYGGTVSHTMVHPPREQRREQHGQKRGTGDAKEEDAIQASD